MFADGTDLRLLRIFVGIVEAGGFAAAQTELNLSLPTISGHMATLETRLKLKLCRRGRGGFALTPEGRRVYEEACQLFAGLARFDGQVRSLRDRLSGPLALGMVDNTITDPALPLDRVFARFAAAAPEVVISVTTRPPQELLRDVITRQLQIAIGSFPRKAPSLSYFELHTEAQNLYCGRDHPLFTVDDARIDARTVGQHAIIARAYWGERDLKALALGTPRAFVNDMEAEARLILSGAYLGYLPDHYAARFVARGALRALRTKLFSYRAPFHAVTTSEAMANPPVRLFMDLLMKEVTHGSARRTPRLAPSLAVQG